MAQTEIAIADTITVGELAEKADISATKLIGELMKNGVMATINERIDRDTAQIILDELELEVRLTKEDTEEEVVNYKKRELSDKAVERPPIVAVMGHVDHGKTSLLDVIRESHTAEGEAGGITQHISAYQVKYKDRSITFLDTPGHEAFSALREHGAKLTDLAIIVVAADDGIKPQTKEAIKFATNAGVKIVVAINKIDKPGADLNRVKQQLSDAGLNPEEWGGDTVIVEVSAKEKTNIDKLMDMILLVTDVEELKAEKDIPAEGIVIEAHTETGRGAVATLLIEHGDVSQGQLLVVGDKMAKIRTLEDHNGKTIKTAGPSTPVLVTGFKTIPRFGDSFVAVKNEKEAKVLMSEQAVGGVKEAKLDMTSSDLLNRIHKDRTTNELPVIVKGDVQGSLKSVIDSLRSLNNEEVKIRVIGSGVGNISENDVKTAATSGALIYAFNVDLPSAVKQVAHRDGVETKIYKVIYELIDDAKTRLEDMLEPEVIETEIGRLVVKGIFRTTRDLVICGGEVTKGKAVPGVTAKVIRDKEIIAEVEVESVKRQTQEAKEVLEGEMCGLQLKTKTKIVIEEGDRIEFLTRETKKRKLT